MSEHVSVETLSMLKEVMEDSFNELIEMYISDSQIRIKSLNEAYAANDSECIRREAHSLKGSSGNIGASIMAELTKQIEEKGREGVLDGVDQLIDQVEEEYKELIIILTDML